MDISAHILILVITVTMTAGGFVLLTTPGRIQNQLFFGFATALTLWACMVLQVLSSTDTDQVLWYIRWASYATLFLPVTFQMLCYSIIIGGGRYRDVLKNVWPMLVTSQVLAFVAFTRFYIRDVKMPGPAFPSLDVPVPVYGPGFIVVQGFVVLGIVFVLFSSLKRMQKLEGIQRAELQFALLAMAVAVTIGGMISFVIPLIFPQFVSQQFGPICIIPLNLIFAYGIATRRILDVPAFLQRATAYGLLTVYLVSLYLGVSVTAMFFLRFWHIQFEMIADILAALVVAFSMSPAHGILQNLSRRLFINKTTLDIRDVAKRGNEIFASISTTEAILGRFLGILEDSGIDAERIHILLATRDAFTEWGVSGADGMPPPLTLLSRSPLIQNLSRDQAPLALDTIRRMRPTPMLTRTAEAMESLRVELSIGIVLKQTLRGVVLLGARQSGRIYSASEQDALQVLCNQLAVALENADLYTEVQDNKIYNDILVDSLVSGVIAVGEDGLINVFNREAQRMTGIAAIDALNHPLDALPDVLANALRITISTGERTHDTETSLSRFGDEEEVHFLLGSSLFHGSRGQVLGALLVLSDVTAQKKLETQVRRSDRMASMGTLSAGMAHEIKNPLVTIKTFTDLLPERFQDADFRETFASLVSQEVRRIDTIVNQLLHFSRPAKPILCLSPLHPVLERTMRLIQEQLKRKDIRLEADLGAIQDTIQADTNLLEQAFINFFLNAVDSMSDKGVLSVRTSTTEVPWHLRQNQATGENGEYIKLVIQDTGCGIPEEALACVFDPFFTTKSHGTGLGLSISHGIIEEHGGLMDVESQVGVGTAFSMYFPLVREEVAVS